MALRGGFEGKSKLSKSQLSAATDNDNPAPSKAKKVILPLLISSLTVTAFLNRQVIAAFDFKQELVNLLDYLSGLGMPGLFIYTIAFMLWEIVVGVAFRLKNGIIANAIGKTSGAIGAFLLGRYVLKDYVEKKLAGNE